MSDFLGHFLKNISGFGQGYLGAEREAIAHNQQLEMQKQQMEMQKLQTSQAQRQFTQEPYLQAADELSKQIVDIRKGIVDGTIQRSDEVLEQLKKMSAMKTATLNEGFRKIGVNFELPVVDYDPIKPIDHQTLRVLADVFQRNPIDRIAEEQGIPVGQLVNNFAMEYNVSPDTIRALGNPDLTVEERTNFALQQDKLEKDTRAKAAGIITDLAKQTYFLALGKTAEGINQQKQILFTTMVTAGMEPDMAEAIAMSLPPLKDALSEFEINKLAQDAAFKVGDWKIKREEMRNQRDIQRMRSQTALQTTAMIQEGAMARTKWAGINNRQIAEMRIAAQQGPLSKEEQEVTKARKEILQSLDALAEVKTQLTPTQRSQHKQKIADNFTKVMRFKYQLDFPRDTALHAINFVIDQGPEKWESYKNNMAQSLYAGGLNENQVTSVLTTLWEELGVFDAGVPFGKVPKARKRKK